MQTTKDALQGWQEYEGSYFVKVGDVEVWLERLLFDGQWYLAVYKDQDLVVPKVVLKVGYEEGKPSGSDKKKD